MCVQQNGRLHDKTNRNNFQLLENIYFYFC